MTFIRYTVSKYFYWLGIFATIITITAIVPINNSCIAKCVILLCFLLAFLVPLLESIFRRKFNLKTIGKSSISFEFSDLFCEECFVITTNRYFDVNPTGDYIAEDSLLGKFVLKYFPNNISDLEKLIKAELEKIKCRSKDDKYDYGTWIKIKVDNKIIYFLAFTDRNKSEQPSDFYQKTMKRFLKTIVNENHGKTIAVPLFGDNNNLSDSGFSDSEISLRSSMAMINDFEITNQRSTLKIKIVALPEKRAKLINVIKNYAK